MCSLVGFRGAPGVEASTGSEAETSTRADHPRSRHWRWSVCVLRRSPPVFDGSRPQVDSGHAEPRVSEFFCNGPSRRRVDPPPRPRQRAPRRATRRRCVPARDLLIPLEGVPVSKSMHAVKTRLPRLALVDLELLPGSCAPVGSVRRYPPAAAPRRAVAAALRCAPAPPAGGHPWWSIPLAGCTRPGRHARA